MFSVAIGACTSNPCINGGTCSTQDLGKSKDLTDDIIECNCPPGYTGMTCESK